MVAAVCDEQSITTGRRPYRNHQNENSEDNRLHHLQATLFILPPINGISPFTENSWRTETGKELSSGTVKYSLNIFEHE